MSVLNHFFGKCNSGYYFPMFWCSTSGRTRVLVDFFEFCDEKAVRWQFLAFCICLTHQISRWWRRGRESNTSKCHGVLPYVIAGGYYINPHSDLSFFFPHKFPINPTSPVTRINTLRTRKYQFREPGRVWLCKMCRILQSVETNSHFHLIWQNRCVTFITLGLAYVFFPRSEAEGLNFRVPSVCVYVSALSTR